jgi:GNAT superfamily N-acetyltransferase
MRRSRPGKLRLRSAADGDELTGIHGPDRDGDRWRRTVVAELDDRAVGWGTVVLDAALRDLYFSEIEVVEDHRRRGIGTAVFAELCNRTERRPFPIFTRAMASQPVRRLFAESLGYDVMVHCPAPQAEPTTAEWRTWITAQPVPAGCRVVAVDEIDRATFNAVWYGYYQWAHEPWAPTYGPDRVAAAMPDYRSTLDADTSVLIVEATEIVAMSLVGDETWDGRTMIICETARPDQPDGARLVRVAAAQSLGRLRHRGVRLVEFEGHTTDPHTPGLFASFPPHNSDPMDIIKLHRPSAMRRGSVHD